MKWLYRKIPRIRPPFDAQKFMPKMGGGLICEDLTFGIKMSIFFKVSKESGMNLREY